LWYGGIHAHPGRRARSVALKHIYISPHSDDVALSCGGQIMSASARRDDMMVMNIFTSESDGLSGDPSDTGAKFPDSIRSDRNLEDTAAWNYAGIETRHALIPEALLRKRFPFSIIPGREDPALVDRIFKFALSHIERYPDANYYFPAGFGNHIDHIACKKAAFRLLDEGHLDRIFLYEDIPYCWLKFIRAQYYVALLRNVDLKEEDRQQAFRSEGDDIASYLQRAMVPFPRGKKLFLAVYLSLLIETMIGKVFSVRNRYFGRIFFKYLDNNQITKKKNLLYHYRSQLPMLFGENPDKLLADYYQSFSREMTIEISKNPIC
jgi:LmbE family N-acetylglucosaminyl deacetylase